MYVCIELPFDKRQEIVITGTVNEVSKCHKNGKQKQLTWEDNLILLD